MTSPRPRRRLRWAAVALAAAIAPALTGCSGRAEPAALPSARLDLPASSWWGGPSYYSQFPKAAASGWTSPSFFPIGVFVAKPDQADSLRRIGINTFMGVEHDGSSMSSVTGTGMSVLAQLSEWTPEEIGDDPRVVGWNLSDECEMGYSGCGDDEQTQLATQRGYAQEARARADGRLLQANFGNGVLGSYWSTTTMKDHLSLVDLSSVDKYAYTSPHVNELMSESPDWPEGRNPASSFAYGWVQTRMESFSTPAGSKPNWVLVESDKPYLSEDGATSISADQMAGAVWNAIIKGASGITYFQHSNDARCGNYSLVDCSGPRAAAAQINARISALAPVLNTEPSTWTFGDGLQTSLRVHDGYAYVLAMTDGGTGRRSFTLPGGLRGHSVEVLDENRTIALKDGKFTDDFAHEYSHHVYRVVI